ncbi:putative quinol monooxygenase [Rhodanobacter aciditrophus]|uniref:Quinol monooxygenase n=1 Tax=Rhodanobacter aciditrophus TaxID=1623218 RepID=A0ABW4B1M0_9GAMM
MSKVILQGHIIVPSHVLDDVLEELPTHIALTRKEVGCLVFNVNQSDNYPLRFNVYEEFANSQAFEAHQARVKASRWGKITQQVERCYQVTMEEAVLK